MAQSKSNYINTAADPGFSRWDHEPRWRKLQRGLNLYVKTKESEPLGEDPTGVSPGCTNATLTQYLCSDLVLAMNGEGSM